MNRSIRGTRVRAAGTVILLLLAGAIIGITVDRLWLLSAPAAATSLTAETMAAHLGLSADEERRLSALLDTLHAEIGAAMVQGPDSLRAATDAAHRRIEAALPPDARHGFHMWIQEYHEQMMHRMRHSTGGTPHMR